MENEDNESEVVDTTELLINGNGYPSKQRTQGWRRRLPSASNVFRTVTFLLIFLTFIFAVMLYYKETKKATTTPPTNKPFFPTAYQQMAKTAVKYMDLNSNPCNDFYQYVCGGYVSSNQLAPNENMYIPSFEIIDYNNEILLEKLVSEQWPLISDLYQSCMQPPELIEYDTLQTLTPYINAINSLQGSQDSQFLPLLAQLHIFGVDAFFDLDVVDNILENSPSRLNHLLLEQGGLTPGINYNNTDSIERLAETIGYVLQLFNPNMTMSQVIGATLEVINVETQVAMIHIRFAHFMDSFVNMSYTQFKQSFTNFNFDYYIQGIGLGNVIKPSSTVILSPPYFFQHLQNIIQKNPLSSIQHYLQWRLIYSLSNFDILPVEGFHIKNPSFTTPIFSAIHKISQNITPSILPQYERRARRFSPLKNNIKNRNPLSPAYTPTDDQVYVCTGQVNQLLGDFVGLLFSEKIIDDNVVWSIANMTQHINSAFQDGLNDLQWIDAISKNLAQYKLQNIIQIIGHPNLLERYHGLVLSASSYTSNVISIQTTQMKDFLSLVETPFIRSDYEFDSTIVNAFYSPLTNTINFPAGILESPMFSSSLPAIFGYARMGYVVGHETTHSLDNQGRLWNSFGVYGDWMTNQSSSNFNTQAQCIVNQFDNYYVNYQGTQVHLNGKNTLGENIADLGGAKNAYRAYKAWELQNDGPEFPDNSLIPFLNNDQLFWVLLGQTWCTLANEQGLVSQISRDVHSPSKFRVNGPLTNLDQFSSAFECPVGSPMNPQNKCLLW